VDSGPPHLSDAELLAYSESRLEGPQLERSEAHLLECDACGQRLEQLLAHDTFVARLREMHTNPGQTVTEVLSATQIMPAGADDPRIGSTLGNHLLLSVLGKGGMGVVYLARDNVMGREVAVKVLHESVARDAEARKRFLEEGRSLGKLNHPNVVTIHQIDESASTFYIVMELLAQGSIGDQIRAHGPLHWREATLILLQACRGLSAAHAKGLIHRDIKPENLLIDSDNQVKISDFGLVKSIDTASLTMTRQLMGTPHYMSPEQCRAEPVDVRCDVYQLGATYYKLITGKDPYAHAKTLIEAIAAHCDEPVPDPREIDPDLPDDCADIIAQAMAKAPQDRYQSVDEMFSDLIVLSDTGTDEMGLDEMVQPTHPSPERAGPGIRPSVSRGTQRGPALAAMIPILLVIITLFVYFLKQKDDGTNQGAAPAAFDPNAPPIKVGVLHSLTGTMSGSETPVVDSIQFAVEEVNRTGGLLGRRVEAVVRDGRSDAAVFAEQAEQLISRDGVCTVFGCWTSASRKTIVPIFQQHDHLLVYSVQYEGLEQSPNVIYMGAAPNQQILPAIKWAFAFQEKRRFFLIGSDYVFPRTANTIAKDVLKELGAELAGEIYIPLGSSDVRAAVAAIEESSPDVILNTINGDSNVAFFRALRAAGITPPKIPTISFSLGEVELQDLDPSDMVGDFASWNYFQSIESAANQHFVEEFRARYGARRVVSDPMESTYVGVLLWADAVRISQSVKPSEIRSAMLGLQIQAPHGLVTIDPKTQHAFKTPRIGRIGEGGQFELVWQSPKPEAPQPYPSTRKPSEWNVYLENLHQLWDGQWAAPDRH